MRLIPGWVTHGRSRAKGGTRAMALLVADLFVGRWRLVQAYGAVVVALAAAITASQFPVVESTAHDFPNLWLMTGLALLAGLQAFKVTRPGGTAVIICPTTCFTFAILLCWGLGPAILAQTAAIVVVTWKHRLSPWTSLITAGQYALCFAAAFGVLAIGHPDPFGEHKPPNILGDAGSTIGAVAAWLLAYGLLTMVEHWLRHGTARPREAASVVGDQMLFKAALLLLSPVFAVAAHVNVAFVPLVFVPLYAVERMARLSAERDRAARLDPLTGLANRTGLKARFDELTNRSGPARLALFVLDLDRFKHVNDALGHE